MRKAKVQMVYRLSDFFKVAACISHINTRGSSIADSLGGENRTCIVQLTSVLFSMTSYALKILERGNQPQGWEIPVCTSHLLNTK